MVRRAGPKERMWSIMSVLTSPIWTSVVPIGLPRSSDRIPAVKWLSPAFDVP